MEKADGTESRKNGKKENEKLHRKRAIRISSVSRSARRIFFVLILVRGGV